MNWEKEDSHNKGVLKRRSPWKPDDFLKIHMVCLMCREGKTFPLSILGFCLGLCTKDRFTREEHANLICFTWQRSLQKEMKTPRCGKTCELIYEIEQSEAIVGN